MIVIKYTMSGQILRNTQKAYVRPLPEMINENSTYQGPSSGRSTLH